jgi:hypothetical protein
MGYPQIIKKFNKISVKFLILAIFSTSVVLLFVKQENPLFSIAWRVIMNGDVYMMAYVNSNIEMIEGNFLTLVLPNKVVNMLGLDPVKNLGMQLMEIVYHADLYVGPNARHNILGYVSFGFFGSLIFSFFIGALVGFLRNKLIKLLKLNLESLITFVLILSPALSLPTDFAYAFFKYISELIVFIIIYTLSVIFSLKKSKRYGKIAEIDINKTNKT